MRILEIIKAWLGWQPPQNYREQLRGQKCNYRDQLRNKANYRDQLRHKGNYRVRRRRK